MTIFGAPSKSLLRRSKRSDPNGKVLSELSASVAAATPEDEPSLLRNIRLGPVAEVVEILVV
jgi:hypothetical protein